MALLASKGVLYFLSTGTRSAWGGTQQADGTYKNTPPAALTKVGGVGDVNTDYDSTDADTTNRDTAPFETGAPAMLKAPGTYKMVYKDTDPGQQALLNAWITQTSIALADLDQASTVSGARGLWADVYVKSFKKTGPVKGIYMIDVTTDIYDSGVPAQLVQVS
jgi:hypothetical protein